MSWYGFDDAKNLIKKAWNSITGSETENKTNASKTKPSTTTKQPTSVIRPKGETVGTVGDEVVITSNKKQKTKTEQTKTTATKAKTTNTKTKTSVTTKQTQTKHFEQKVTINDIKEIVKSINDKCKKLGITLEEAKQHINEQLGASLNSNEIKDIATRFRMLSCIDAALTMQLMYKSKDNVSSDIDAGEFLKLVSENYYNVITNGGITDIKEFRKNIDNILNNAYKQYQNASTHEEKAAILDNARKAIINNIDNEYETKQKGKNKSEIVKLEKEKQHRLVASERAAQLGFNLKVSPKDRKFGIYLRSGANFSEAQEYAKAATNSETRVLIADSLNHDFEIKALELKSKFGDSISADEYGKAIALNMQDMSLDAATQFETDAYEYKQKVLNGEIDAPWMSEEHLTAESAAIGVGITNNRNISTTEKAELLNTWDKHAREFSDYSAVKENYNTKYNNEQNEQVTNSCNSVKKVLLENFDNDIERLPRVWEKRKKENNDIKPKASEATLKQELKSKSVADIQKDYNNTMAEIAKIVLSNDIEYKHRVDDILDYLKAYSGTDIGLMAVGCSTHTISRIIQTFPEKANDILDVVAPTMCFAGKKAVEQIVDKGEKHAAA